MQAAVRAPDLDAIKALVKAGASVNESDSCGDTPLMAAFTPEIGWPSKSMHPSREEIAKENRRMDQAADARMVVALWLLDSGANPLALDAYGNSALSRAAGFGLGGATLLVIIRKMIAAGANVNQQGSKGRTPLMDAAWTGRKDVAELLLSAGANKMARDHEGKTAEDIARLGNRVEMLQLLSEGKVHSEH
ncbi:MAG: ankyrin repeat domain-containing protein [Myxococcales bacterium]|nr:ankyrin repeat domain-containing protein [Myxococcales bacterium]